MTADSLPAAGPVVAARPLVADRLVVRILEAPLDDEVPMSFSSLRVRRTCLVEIHAGGLVGIGESWVNYPAWGSAERVATLADGVAGLVLGSDVTDPAAVLDRLVGALLPIGRQWGAPGPVWQAVSGVDLALWDLAGKAAGCPSGALLPDAAPELRRVVPAYASGVGPTDVPALCERALRQGLSALKVKVGFGRERDAATLAAVRAVCGPDFRVFADANQAWDLPTAIAMSGLLADHGVEWVEEPLAGNDPGELQQLVEATGLPVATGENVYGVAAFARYLRTPGVAQIQPDTAKTGGLTVASAVAAQAADAGTGVSPHCYSGALCLASSVQLGAAFGVVDWIELDVRDNPLRTDLLAAPLAVHEGDLAVPRLPGLAGDLDDAAVAHHQVHLTERNRSS